MNPKNTRAKKPQSLKINQLLSPSPRANGANSIQASGHTVNSADPPIMESRTSDNADILKEIRYIHHDLQEKIQKVGNDVTTIKENLDSLRSDVVNLGSRITEAEERVSQLEDENGRLGSSMQNMNSKVEQLEARLEYHENYSRRNNLRLKGVPEDTKHGDRVLDCVNDLLWCLFTNSGAAADDMAIERAHRVPTTSLRNSDGSGRPAGPGNILVRFLRFTDRERVRLRAKELGTFKWKDSKVDIFPDFTREVQEKRRRFMDVRRICMKRGMQYSMQYPAVFWVTLGGKRQRFKDAAAAKRCVESYHPAEEAE